MNNLRPIARRLAIRPILPATSSIRFNSTTAPVDPKAKANAFLEALPGNSADQQDRLGYLSRKLRWMCGC
ncbi:hypothetical protein Pst134EA_032159 [Puccinia striiformis f. sp. tritici]|uniref:uncharacterized protein n=1 Tax=Puccinia striiformis f. sp. tritici TaxID=168172 RepID=UPI002007A04F|nr:uncharacterized protein Pst134EA_032159 [Puccinia striiformis f. sp. tritici]KAH9441857.1 hypothetical protein Pst134EA_032159 [Puccinia striiformis f. sp. tritici]